MDDTATPFDDHVTGWDLHALETPIIVDIPEQIPEDLNPQQEKCLEMLVAFLLSDDTAATRIGEVARTGVVALRSGDIVMELHETLHDWTLVSTIGDPDPLDLATAARLRAHRLAGERLARDEAIS